MDAATALVVAGGVPRTSPASALVVVVNDPDRATDSVQALRALRDASPGRLLRVLVATGSHVWGDAAREAHEAPLRAAAGEPSEFFWHDGESPSHSVVGPAHLDTFLAEATDVVGVGSVEPHWFAGLTGAHKTLTVGVMHREDITANHALAMTVDARPFRLAGNPVHEGLAAVLHALEDGRRVVALQHIGTRWFGGAPLACLDEAAAVAATRWRRVVPKPFDLLLAVVAPPLHRTLYQAEKGVKNNEFAVRDGGMVVLDAPCEDGLGPDRFFQTLMKAPDLAAVMERITRKGYRLGDHKAFRLRSLQARGVQVALVSPTFPREAGAAVGIGVFASREEASRTLRGRFGGSSRAAVVEDAGHMVVEA